MISFLNLFATAHLMLSVCLTASAATNVYATNDDISKCLDLQAIGAAFAQSSTVQDFENLLNDSSLMLSNLDLNQDGYVDYLRVVETVEGNTHVFVIEAVLGPDVYQEVATIVADVDNNSPNYNVQIIGSSFIYGPDYIIEPVYVTRPLILAHFLIPHYRVWHSPWYWDHYPVCYRYHTTRYYSGYHAYINSYMRTHRYCHSVNRAHSYHYPSYRHLSNPVRHNDYRNAHPGRSFTERNANVPGGSYGRTRSSAPGRTYGNTRPQGTTRSYGNGSQGYNRHYDNRGRQSTTRPSGTMTRPQSATRSSGTMTRPQGATHSSGTMTRPNGSARPSAPASSYHRAGSGKSTGQRQASPTKGSSTKSSGTQTRPSSGQTTRSAGQTAKSAGSYSRPSGSSSRSSGSYNRLSSSGSYTRSSGYSSGRSSGSYSHSRSSSSSGRSSSGSSRGYSGTSRGGSSHRR